MHRLHPTTYVWCKRLAAQYNACNNCPSVGLVPLWICQGPEPKDACEHYRFVPDSIEPHRCTFGDVRRSEVWQAEGRAEG